ncbi:TPA: MaoC family dehydratase N-terminal domain-containing protein [Citrobacter freundii]
MNAIDVSALTPWIGRQERSEAMLTPQILQAYRAIFAPYLWEQENVAPPGLHWCLAPTTAQALMAEIDIDGHPQRGGFLPPVPLPRRMWAGGEIETLSPLPIGEPIQRISTIRDIQFKSGRSGSLCFVTVDHTLSVGGVPAIRERQDIVYRAAATPATIASGERREGDREITLATPSTLLFRYSALTFNAHRIHYDLPYATEQEGYTGLVVQGPLQASLMFNLAASCAERVPSRFRYRGQAPLIAGPGFRTAAAWDAGGEQLQLWTQDMFGAINMQAEAIW